MPASGSQVSAWSAQPGYPTACRNALIVTGSEDQGAEDRERPEGEDDGVRGHLSGL